MKELSNFEEHRKSKNRPVEPVFSFFLNKAPRLLLTPRISPNIVAAMLPEC
jgi:hypothetical protein